MGRLPGNGCSVIMGGDCRITRMGALRTLWPPYSRVGKNVDYHSVLCSDLDCIDSGIILHGNLNF